MTDWRSRPDRQDYSKSCGQCSGGMKVNGRCTNATCPSNGGSGLARAAGAAAGTGAAASSCDAALAPGTSLGTVLIAVFFTAAAAAVLVAIVAMAVGAAKSQPKRSEQRGAVDVEPAERGDLL